MAQAGGRSITTGRAGYYLYLIPGGLGFLVIVLIPFVMNIGISFTAWRGVRWPRFVGLQNYAQLLQDDIFWVSLQHTVAFVFAMAIVPTIISLVLAAVLFDYVSPRFGSRVASFFRAGFYLPQILPLSVAGVLWGWILNPFGAANGILDILGLHDMRQNWLGDPGLALLSVMFVMVWLQIGYSLVIFMAGLGRVDPALYEAAEIDGAGWWQRFRLITLSMLKPEIFVVGLTTTIAALKVFAPIFVLTNGGPDNATNVPSYFAYYHFFSTVRVGYGAAISTAQTVLIVVLAAIFLRVQSQQTDVEQE
jgi:raffinose/stachyose/melibiose transport system permease protein